MTFVLSLALLLAPGTAPQSATDANALSRRRALEGEATDALRAGETRRAAELLGQALAWQPDHPRLLLQRALAQAQSGQAPSAASTLQQMAAMGLVLATDSQNEFQKLPGWEKLAAQFRANGLPRVRSRPAFGLDDPLFHPEGLAHDPVLESYLVGGVRSRSIVRIGEGEEGEPEVFACAEDDGLLGVFDLVVDPEREILWAATAHAAPLVNVDPARVGQAELRGYDLETAELLTTLTLGSRNLPRLFGSLALAADGRLFVSDSLGRQVFGLQPEGEELETVAGPEPFGSPQGLALWADDTILIVADYSQGLLRVEIDSGEVVRLAPPENTCLIGIDGLATHAGTLLAIQNGVVPQRVLRLRLDPEARSIEAVEVLESSHPEYPEPTQGKVIGEELLYIANSLWPHLDARGRLRAGSRPRPPVVLRLPLADPEKTSERPDAPQRR